MFASLYGTVFQNVHTIICIFLHQEPFLENKQMKTSDINFKMTRKQIKMLDIFKHLLVVYFILYTKLHKILL